MASLFENFVREVLEIPPVGKYASITITKELNNRLQQLYSLGMDPRETRRFIERNYPELLDNTVTL